MLSGFAITVTPAEKNNLVILILFLWLWDNLNNAGSIYSSDVWYNSWKIDFLYKNNTESGRSNAPFLRIIV